MVTISQSTIDAMRASEKYNRREYEKEQTAKAYSSMREKVEATVFDAVRPLHGGSEIYHRAMAKIITTTVFVAMITEAEAFPHDYVDTIRSFLMVREIPSGAEQ